MPSDSQINSIERALASIWKIPLSHEDQVEQSALAKIVYETLSYEELKQNIDVLHDISREIKSLKKKSPPESSLVHNPELIKSINRGRYHSRFVFGLGAVGISDRLSLTALELTLNRLNDKEYSNHISVEKILETLKVNYKKLSPKARRRWQKEMALKKAKITVDESSLEEYIHRLMQAFQKRNQRIEGEDKFDEMLCADLFDDSKREIDAEINAMDYAKRALKYPNTKAAEDKIKIRTQEKINRLIKLSKDSFEVFVNNAIDLEIVDIMISKSSPDKLHLQHKINTVTANEGLFKPLLMASILQDIEDEKEPEPEGIENSELAENSEGNLLKRKESKRTLEAEKSLSLNNLGLMMRTCTLLRIEQEEKRKLSKLDELNKDLEHESDLSIGLGAIETFSEAVNLPNEIIGNAAKIIDNVNTVHTIAISAQKTAKALDVKSGLVSVIAGAINIVLLPFKYGIVEKRWPKGAEWVDIATSVTLVVLGALLLASVGGAAAAGFLFLGIAVVGFVKTVVDADKTNRELISRKTKNIQQEQSKAALVEDLKVIQKDINDKLKELEKALKERPDKIAYNTIDSITGNKDNPQEGTLTYLYKLRQTKTEAYIKIAVENLIVKSNIQKLERKDKSLVHNAKQFSYVSAAILAVAGAALFFVFPPVGAAILIASAAITGAVLITDFIAKRIQNYKNRKIKKAKESIQHPSFVKEAENDLFKKYDICPHDESSYKIDQSLMGKELTRHKDEHKQKEKMMEESPFHKMFIPKPPAPRIKKKEDEPETSTLPSLNGRNL